MKKRSRLLICLILIAALLAGCAKNSTEETTAEIQSAQTETEKVTEAATPAQNAGETAGGNAAENAAETAARTAAPLTNADRATFAFTRENFPAMDGSTATVPLGQAVASVLLGESPEDVAELAEFHKTTQSFRNLKNGNCDILIVGEPNAAVFDEMKEEGFEYELEEIATDALIFVVNKDNPVNNLTTEQIRDIYTGKITNWKEVGGNDAPIAAFQRNEGAGSQALMKKLVMKDTPLMEAPSTLVATEMGELMESVKSYDNSANAIGYSVYYYANDMKKAEGLKLLSVDGVEPNAETIRARKYPHLNAYYCVIDKREPKDSSTRVLFNWMMSKDGQALVDAEGYVASGDPAKLSEKLPDGKIVKTDYTYYRKLAIPENKFERLAEGDLTSLSARDDYGFLYPYAGSTTYVNDGNGYAYESGKLKGFFDEKGRLVTDPVFTDIDTASWYDGKTRAMKTAPLWIFSRVKDKETLEYSFATMDGTVVCDKWYEYILPGDDRLICKYNDYRDFDVYDLTGKKVLTSKDLARWVPGEGEDWPGVIEYGDGWYMISVKYDEYYYVKESDKSELGPYRTGRNFDHGRAVADDMASTDWSTGTGVIDEKGKWIIEPKYSYVDELQNGNFVCAYAGGSIHDLYDKNGKFLKTVETGYITPANYGFYSTSTGNGDDAKDMLTCYDFDGSVIFEDTNNEWMPREDCWEPVGHDGLISRKAGAGRQLKNILTGKTVYVEGTDSITPFYRLEDTPDIKRAVARNSFYDGDTEFYYSHERVYDNDLNELFDDYGGTLVPDDDQATGRWYVKSYAEDGKVRLWDTDFKKFVEVVSDPLIVNEKFIVSDEYASTCYDKNGNILFSYSLINSMGD